MGTVSTKEHRARLILRSAARDPSRGHRVRAHPQFLHHRPHRPRKVHAGRPHAAADRDRRRTRHARPVPGPHGHRTRTGDHDQIPGRPPPLDRRGRALRPQHDRHARARRLLLRGQPLARRVRGGDPPRRRDPGDRGADPGQPLHGPRQRPRDHPRAQQDRPPLGPAREVRGGARLAHRRRPRRMPRGVGQDRHGGGRAARPDRRRGPRARRPGGRPGPRDDLRLRLRHLPRRGHLRPGQGRQARPARAHPDDVDGRHPRAPGDRRHLARAHAHRGPGRGRGRIPHHRGEGRAPVPRGRHRHVGEGPRSRTARRLPGPQAHGLLRRLSDRRIGLPRSARRPGQAQAERRRAVIRARELRRPRLRLPMRVPGAAPPGDRPRTARAGVRHRHHRHIAVGRLPGGDRRRRGGGRHQSVGVPRGQAQADLRADRARHGAHPRRLHGDDHGAVPAAARRHAGDGLPLV